MLLLPFSLAPGLVCICPVAHFGSEVFSVPPNHPSLMLPAGSATSRQNKSMKDFCEPD